MWSPGFLTPGSGSTTPPSTTPIPPRWSRASSPASRMPPRTARWWPPCSPAPAPMPSAPAATPRNTPSTTACGPRSTAPTWSSSTTWSTPSSCARSPSSAGSTACGSPAARKSALACDITISSDLAIYGQAGPRHGSAPVGGASDFLPWFLTIEDAMWNCVSCEMWRAYKMKAQGPHLQSACPSSKTTRASGCAIPRSSPNDYVKDGEIVYGEYKTGDEFKQARELGQRAS